MYRVVYELNRRPGGATQSLTTHTELTFRSGAGQGAATPPHIQGATGPPITSAKMEVRVGNGTWQTLPPTVVGPGRYHFPLTTTAAQAGAGVDLRVTGTDANGGRIVQTTTQTFVVAS